MGQTASTVWFCRFTLSTLMADGTQRINVEFVDESDEHTIGGHTLLVLPDGKAVRNENTGMIVASPAPQALIDAANAYIKALGEMVAGGVDKACLKL